MKTLANHILSTSAVQLVQVNHISLCRSWVKHFSAMQYKQQLLLDLHTEKQMDRQFIEAHKVLYIPVTVQSGDIRARLEILTIIHCTNQCSADWSICHTRKSIG